MSNAENISLSNELAPLAARRGVAIDAADGWAVPVGQPMAGGGINAVAFLHAFRRRWLAALSVGVICAAAAGLATWIGYGPHYQASRFLRVAQQPDVIAFDSRRVADPANEFEIYKNTQQQLVKSRYVLSKALDRPEVVALNLDQKGHGDLIAWLTDKLTVRFPGKAEIMEVSMTSRDKKEAETLVGAVVDAYISDVIDVEKNKRKLRLNELDRIYTAKETEVRTARSNLKQLAEQLGTSDKDALSLKQQIAMQQFADYQRELMRVQFELRKAKGELDAQKALLDSVADMEVSAFEIDEYAKNDPVSKQLADELAFKRMDLAYQEANIAPGAKGRHVDKFKTDFQMIESQVAEVQQKFADAIRAKKRAEIEKDRQKYEVEVGVLMEQEREFSREVAKRRDDAERLSQSSIDLEMMRAGISQLDLMLKGLAEERDKLRVELNSASRVSSLPTSKSSDEEYLPSLRIALAAMAALAGLALPVGLIVWGDARTNRINTAEDVSRGLGLQVVGALPIMPAKLARSQGKTRGGRFWATRMAEAVDGIAARLLRAASDYRSRVVLVTSAAGGEGKSFLAAQLAGSLARNGRRTVVVDFNLRRPRLDSRFGVPLEAGVSNVLRGECGIAEVAHETSLEGLSVIPAGRWDRAALAALAKGGAKQIFDRLREEYEFVIVDSSAVLPVADTRFVSQHVDTVVLSVFRDRSRAAQVDAARELLEAFGVRSLEAVFIGPSDIMRGREIGYATQLQG